MGLETAEAIRVVIPSANSPLTLQIYADFFIYKNFSNAVSIRNRKKSSWNQLALTQVFLKYFFVNTATGEKSGEMLAVVSLKEDAAEE